jgi:hypothetical protein
MLLAHPDIKRIEPGLRLSLEELSRYSAEDLSIHENISGLLEEKGVLSVSASRFPDGALIAIEFLLYREGFVFTDGYAISISYGRVSKRNTPDRWIYSRDLCKNWFIVEKI